MLGRSHPPGEDGLILTFHDGRPVRRNRFGAMWRQSVVPAGLSEDFRYHDLRHHFARALIQHGTAGSPDNRIYVDHSR